MCDMSAQQLGRNLVIAIHFGETVVPLELYFPERIRQGELRHQRTRQMVVRRETWTHNLELSRFEVDAHPVCGNGRHKRLSAVEHFVHRSGTPERMHDVPERR